MYLSQAQYNANLFGEGFQTWSWIKSQIINKSRMKVLVASARSYSSTIDFLLSNYNGIELYVLFDMQVSEIEKQEVKRKYGKRFTEITEPREFFFDLVVLNPPYSKIGNIKYPSDVFIEESAKWLKDDGDLVALIPARNLAFNSASGKKLKRTLTLDSVHYSLNNFSFLEVWSSIVGIIGRKSPSLTQDKTLRIYLDESIIAKNASQKFLPKLENKNNISENLIRLSLKCFDANNLEKWGEGQLYLYNGLKFYNQKPNVKVEYTSSINPCGKIWSLPGSSADLSSFNKFLTCNLFKVFSMNEVYSRGNTSTSAWIRGCIPDCWRDLDTNEKIYQHFNLTQEEIEFVETFKGFPIN